MEEILDQVSKAWLATNAALFKHVLDYEAKLEKFLNKTGGWIREQEERIWTKMFEITGEAGTPLCPSLDIMLHLLDTLPSFPANLSYQSNSPTICGFAPEAYAQPWTWHASCLSRTARRPRMYWGKLLSRVQEVVLYPEQVQVHLPPPPQNPHRPRKTPMLPCSLLHLRSVPHPNADMPSPLPRSTRSLTPLPTRSRHLGTNLKVVIQALEFIQIKLWVHQW